MMEAIIAKRNLTLRFTGTVELATGLKNDSNLKNKR